MTITKQKIKDLNSFSLLLVILLSFLVHNAINSQSNSIELKFLSELDKFNLKKYALPLLKYKILDISLNQRKINETGLEISYDFNNNVKTYNGSNVFFEIDTRSDMNLSSRGQFRHFLGHKIFGGAFFSASMGFGMGYGRLEEVTDAWTTIRMLKELSRINRLKRILDDIDIASIAETISKIKNVRFFDSRNKRIERLKAIDKIFKDNGLITKGDISYFNIMSDVFEYSRFSPRRRLASSIIALDLRPHYSLIDVSYDRFLPDFRSYGLGIELRNQYFIPLNIFSQLDFGYLINFDYSTILPKIIKEHSSPIIIPSIFVNYSYYITLRTTYHSNFNFALVYLLKPESKIDTGFPFYTMTWENKFSYFISPRKRFYIDFLILYNNKQYRYFGNYLQKYEWGDVSLSRPIFSKGFNYDLRMRFKYAIF